MAAYIEEFLYRGHAPGSGKNAAWHIVLAEEVTGDLGEPRTIRVGPMSMADAAARGYDLPTVIASINAEAVAARDEAIAAKEAAETERNEAVIARDAMKAERDKAISDASPKAGRSQVAGRQAG